MKPDKRNLALVVIYLAVQESQILSLLCLDLWGIRSVRRHLLGRQTRPINLSTKGYLTTTHHKESAIPARGTVWRFQLCSQIAFSDIPVTIHRRRPFSWAIFIVLPLSSDALIFPPPHEFFSTSQTNLNTTEISRDREIWLYVFCFHRYGHKAVETGRLSFSPMMGAVVFITNGTRHTRIISIHITKTIRHICDVMQFIH